MANLQTTTCATRNAAKLGLSTSRIQDLRAEPLLSQDDGLPVLVAELASALAAERRLRSELVVELGKLYDRLDELEKAEATKK